MNYPLNTLRNFSISLIFLFLIGSGCENSDNAPTPLESADPPPQYDWLVMSYEGELTSDKWLTSSPQSLFRNDVYITNNGYERHSSKTLDKILRWRIKEDKDKGRYLSTQVRLDKTKSNMQLYRAQVSFRRDEESRGIENITASKGWPDWYTSIGRELIQSFSIRVPKGQRVDFPSLSVAEGFDDPASLQVWQNRTRFNDNNKRGNVLIAIYLRGDEWLLKNDWDRSPYFPGAKFNGFKLGDVRPGEWLDLIIRLVPDKNDGEVEIYARKEGEENYQLAYTYQGPFYGPIDKRWIPDQIDAREAVGLPSYGIYPSTRFAPNKVDKKWLRDGIKEVTVNHSEIRLLQYPRGQAPMDSIVASVEYYF